MSRFLAIDVDQTHIHVVAGVAKGGVPTLESAAALPLKAPLSVATAADLGKEFREALKAAGIAPAPVLVSLGRDRVIVKDAKIPPGVPETEEASLVRFQASKDLTEAVDAVIIDYYTLTRPEPDGQRRAVIVSLRREYLEAYRQFCTAAGLKLAGATPRPIGSLGALTRAIKTGDVTAPVSRSASVAMLSRGDKWGELMIARDDQVLFSRAVSAGALNSEAMLLGEIKRNLAVYNGQTPQQPVEALFVVEASGPAGAWSGRIRAGLTIPVQGFDPLFGVENDTTPETRGHYAGLVGLLQQKSLALPLAVDFLSPREPKPPSRRKENMMALAGFGVLLLVLGALVFGYTRVMAKDRQVAQLIKEKKAADDTLKELEVDRKRIKAVREWDQKRINWLDELYDMSSRFPDSKTTKLDLFRGEARDPEKGAKVKNVGRIVMKVQTSADKAFNNLQSVMTSDRKYHDIVPQTRGGTGGRLGSNMQLYELKAELEHRMPNEYIRKMVEPPSLKPDKRTGPEENPRGKGGVGGGGGFPGGGGFGGGFPGGFGGPES
ncbi:type IV pilus biogenesis protein PilM [Zavarzinella formosa]|uniref:type IV pilus biogenesis protein PilM n=1 Tax=Zavarzinella formosa TaxID=360055 RepID=UPI000382BE14|nr:pilus assembly protein PilM [Zavarzinella formosa]